MSLILIAIFSLASYITGLRAVLQGKYKPNVYSRIIWFLLAANALVGLLKLDSSSGTLALSVMQTFGSLLLLLASFKYSIFTFGTTEKISTILLFTSLTVWLFGDYPAINVYISLIAHFIGGIPTLQTVVNKASSENMMFWGFFAVASGIALLTADKSSFEHYMFALYFLIFNATMAILASRQYLPKHKQMQPIEM